MSEQCPSSRSHPSLVYPNAPLPALCAYMPDANSGLVTRNQPFAYWVAYPHNSCVSAHVNGYISVNGVLLFLWRICLSGGLSSMPFNFERSTIRYHPRTLFCYLKVCYLRWIVECSIYKTTRVASDTARKSAAHRHLANRKDLNTHFRVAYVRTPHADSLSKCQQVLFVAEEFTTCRHAGWRPPCSATLQSTFTQVFKTCKHDAFLYLLLRRRLLNKWSAWPRLRWSLPLTVPFG